MMLPLLSIESHQNLGAARAFSMVATADSQLLIARRNGNGSTVNA
jgi:hypothetical protein